MLVWQHGRIMARSLLLLHPPAVHTQKRTHTHIERMRAHAPTYRHTRTHTHTHALNACARTHPLTPTTTHHTYNNHLLNRAMTRARTRAEPQGQSSKLRGCISNGLGAEIRFRGPRSVSLSPITSALRVPTRLACGPCGSPDVLGTVCLPAPAAPRPGRRGERVRSYKH
jgi:hypothetical protein